MDYKHNSNLNQRKPATRADKRRLAGGAAGLGIVTKTSSPLFEVISDDGEVLSFSQKDDGTLKYIVDSQQARARRWQLKSVVNRLLPSSRTSKCHLYRSPNGQGGLSGIQVQKTIEHNKAYYKGLMSCGSVWNCPVCAAKVSERRRIEMQTALDAAKAMHLKPFLITLTNSHGIGDDLAVMKEQQQKALKILSSGKNSIKNTLERHQIKQIGFIRTYEVTHGKQNGFHPHFHMIVFIESSLKPDEIKETLKQMYFKRWLSACEKVGLPLPSDAHGVDVKNGSFAGDYVAKWGLADEVAKTLNKKGRKKSVSPWDLLQAIFDQDNDDYPREYAMGLFYAYSRSMSGARQLYWSNGLREKLGLNPEIDDESLANQDTDETSELLSTISFERWKQIRRSRSEARILEIAETQPAVLNEYLTRFDVELLDQDKADPLRLSLIIPEIEYSKLTADFFPTDAPTMAVRLGLSKIIKIE